MSFVGSGGKLLSGLEKEKEKGEGKEKEKRIISFQQIERGKLMGNVDEEKEPSMIDEWSGWAPF